LGSNLRILARDSVDLGSNLRILAWDSVDLGSNIRILAWDCADLGSNLRRLAWNSVQFSGVWLGTNPPVTRILRRDNLMLVIQRHKKELRPC
jgi:hypothetical protein